MVRLVVDNRVRVDGYRNLPVEVRDELRKAHEHDNPQRAKLKSLGLPYWSEPKKLVTWRATRNGNVSLPRGGLSTARSILDKAGVDFTVKDARTDGVGPRSVPEHRLELYPYQADAVDVLASRQQGIIRAPTGSGKTSIALALAARLNLPTLIVVWSGPLFQQWEERIERELGIPAEKIGKIRAGKCKFGPVTVGMQQTISARGIATYRDYFGVVMLDETHRAAATTAYEAIDPFPAKYRIGISADERRKDRKECVIYDLFGDVVVDIRREDLIESGHVLDVEIRVVPTGFRADWYGFDKSGDAREDLDFDRLLGEMSADEARNQLAVENAVAEVAEGEQVLVFSHRREHCQALAERIAARGVRVGTLIGGEDYAKEFARTRAGMLSGEVRVGVGTYQAIGTGVDLPRVGAAVCVTPVASNKQFFGQVRGRICRIAKGKSGARLTYLWDRAVSPGHLKNLLTWNTQVLVLENNVWHDGRSWRPVRANSEEADDEKEKRGRESG